MSKYKCPAPQSKFLLYSPIYDLHVYFEKLRKKEGEEDSKLLSNRVK